MNEVKPSKIGPSYFALNWLREHVGYDESIEAEAFELVETAHELDLALDRFRAEERERCAAIADAIVAGSKGKDPGSRGIRIGARAIAAGIRSGDPS